MSFCIYITVNIRYMIVLLYNTSPFGVFFSEAQFYTLKRIIYPCIIGIFPLPSAGFVRIDDAGIVFIHLTGAGTHKADDAVHPLPERGKIYEISDKFTVKTQ